ncbi:hypothetical protein Q4489_02680 [Thalassotalea sp. 1_MG-2023]|uniref:hypothetical protein n=1 Tax=Thalassotalea sp. 1_MG-2023 TaxID=3062680 RepID=UPI0026E14A36|nr:hypothetical protein [Thalassotalea sp. 1_MG-2023]MDO6425896.1 hypothetical protein [Thalassotalea sp. 1_MG-2023]
MTLEKSIAVIMTLLISAASQAAYITINEAELDRIYSQDSFGDLPIDIRIGQPSEILAPNLLDITTREEVRQLFNMHSGGFNIVNFYFIDTISACGSSTGTNIVGCGEYFGNDFVVESRFADSGYGSELLAHELGHNLGLPHLNGAFLMNPSLNNRTLLTEAEVAQIRQSPLVQNVDNTYWIDINPVLIVRELTKVSEPATFVLFMLAVFTLLCRCKVSNKYAFSLERY